MSFYLDVQLYSLQSNKYFISFTNQQTSIILNCLEQLTNNQMGNTPNPLSLLCDDVQSLQEYNESIRTLRQFIDQCQSVYYQIEKLKKQRYPKTEVENNFVLNSQMSETSNQQLMQYFHLSQIQQQLNIIKDQSTDILQKHIQLNDGKSRVEAITIINQFLKQTNDQFIKIKETIDLIRKSNTEYTEKQDYVFFTYKNNEHRAFRVQIIQKERIFLSQKLQKTENIRKTLNKSQGLKIDIPFDLNQKINKLIIEKDQIQQRIAQSQNAISLLPQENKAYINKVFSEILPANQLFYKKITQKDISYFQQQFDVSKLSSQTFELSIKFFNNITDHSFVKIEDMKSFSSLNWEKVSCLNLVGCKINSKKWKQLFQNANNFPQLRILWISQNFIENMKLEDFYEFPNLQFVYYEILRVKNEKQFKLLNIIQTHMENNFNSLIVNDKNVRLKRKIRIYF